MLEPWSANRSNIRWECRSENLAPLQFSMLLYLGTFSHMMLIGILKNKCSVISCQRMYLDFINRVWTGYERVCKTDLSGCYSFLLVPSKVCILSNNSGYPKRSPEQFWRTSLWLLLSWAVSSLDCHCLWDMPLPNIRPCSPLAYNLLIGSVAS